jgi:hypothetical protein
MKKRQKPGCNQKNPERNDVTALLPMRNERKLHRYIFFEGKGGRINERNAPALVATTTPADMAFWVLPGQNLSADTATPNSV